MKTAIQEVVNMTWPTIVIVVSILMMLRVTHIFKSEKGSFVLYEEIFKLTFVVYILMLFQLVTKQDIQVAGTNFVPFREIMRYEYGSAEFYRQVIGNIVLFIPLGFYATCYCKLRGISGITLISLLSSVIIETVQYFIGRSVDIDDVILNTIGGIIGFLLYKGLNAIWSRMPNFLKSKWLYNFLSILFIIISVLYILNII